MFVVPLFFAQSQHLNLCYFIYLLIRPLTQNEWIGIQLFGLTEEKILEDDMRDIKFRQAIFKNDEFHHWHYWGFVGYRGEFIGPITIAGLANIWTIKSSEEYIGLEDKNSKEIYEGDIVQFDVVVPIWNDEKHEVEEHRPETWRRVVEYKTPKFIIHWYPEKMKIIGNIRENPELLGE